MFQHYVELAISVEPRRGKSYPLSVRSPGGEARGILRLPTADPTYQALEGALEHLNTNAAMLTQLGQILFNALFRDNPDIKEVYDQTQGSLKHDQGLRITFYIGENETEAARLPWEFLYDPKQIGPMATLDAPIARYLPQAAVVQSIEIKPPLRILLTGAETPPKPDIAGALAAVEESLKELGDAVRVTVEPHLTRQQFQRLLRDEYHIWHFVGHGTPATADTSGALLFESVGGDSEEIGAQELGILLNRNSIRLIVLNACDTGKLTVDPFRAIAPALIKAQIPGVIAMQLRIEQDAAKAFSSEFYRALAEGHPLDACVTEGRKSIIFVSGLRNPDWGIPVVYTRAESGRLFELPASASDANTVSGGTSVSVGSGNTLNDSSIHISNVGSTNTGGHMGTQDSDLDDQLKRLKIDALKNQIVEKQRRLYNLQLTAARYGINTPPEIATQIEDLEGRRDYRGNIVAPGEIAKLEQALKELGG